MLMGATHGHDDASEALSGTIAVVGDDAVATRWPHPTGSVAAADGRADSVATAMAVAAAAALVTDGILLPAMATGVGAGAGEATNLKSVHARLADGG